MNMPPAPPPEGALIEEARREARLSVRAAARRAGISEGWWRQVVKGYQSLSGGARGDIQGPAETVAKMASAVGVTADRMRTEGQRPDAADLMGSLAAISSSHADSSDIPISEEEREAAQPIADDIHDLLLAAAVRTGNLDPPGDEIFERGSWDAQTWDRLRRQFPSTRRRLWMIALAAVPDAGQPSRRHGSAAGLTPEAALSRGSSAGGGA